MRFSSSVWATRAYVLSTFGGIPEAAVTPPPASSGFQEPRRALKDYVLCSRTPRGGTQADKPCFSGPPSFFQLGEKSGPGAVPASSAKSV